MRVRRVQRRVEEVDRVGHDGADGTQFGKCAGAVAAEGGRESARLDDLGGVRFPHGVHEKEKKKR